MGEVSIDANFKLAAEEAPPITDAIRARFKDVQKWVAVDKGSLRVSILKGELNEGVFNLEGAARSAIVNACDGLKVAPPPFTVEAVEISGLGAKRAHAEIKKGLHISVVAVGSGAKFSTLQLMYGQARSADAERIEKSFKVHPRP